MTQCAICKYKASDKGVDPQCSGCNKVYHLKCSGISEVDWDYITSHNKCWYCKTCSTKDLRGDDRIASPLSQRTSKEALRKNQKPSPSNKHYTPDTEVLLKEIKMLKSDMNSVLETTKLELAESIEFCHETIRGVGDKLAKLEEKIMLLESAYAKVARENVSLKEEVNELHIKMEEMEQEKKLSMLEIHGLPVKQNENLVHIVSEIGRVLDVSIQDRDIVQISRMGIRFQNNVQNNNNDRAPGILIKLSSERKVEEIINKRKVKRNLNTSHIGMEGDKPIFINESLTKRNKIIYKEAREMSRNGKLRYVWLNRGRVLVRKEDGARVKNIISLKQLDEI